ncbi:MAG TPA: hypothetical protein VHO50_04700 [Bacteroidales bacterium]|nr:hypothetical protein [Bacteroidales bacterium]
MKSINKPLEDLNAIKTIMDRSTRFLSFSGLSGVFAGFSALAGATYAFTVLKNQPENIITKLFTAAIAVLLFAVSVAVFLSYKKARKKGLPLWTPVSKRLVVSMAIPLVTGGLFILILINKEVFSLIIPVMLIFYGFSLVNAGKITFNEVFYLGLCQVLAGLISAILPEYSLYFWALGFGILHIFYGLLMYRKYDR